MNNCLLMLLHYSADLMAGVSKQARGRTMCVDHEEVCAQPVDLFVSFPAALSHGHHGDQKGYARHFVRKQLGRVYCMQSCEERFPAGRRSRDCIVGEEHRLSWF